MTQGTKTNPMSEAWAPIKSVGGELRPRADEIAPRTSRQAARAGNRKTLDL